MKEVDALRLLRNTEHASSNADQVLTSARPLIKSDRIHRAGNEMWDIYEQTLVAAVEVSDDELAMHCLSRLSDKFPQSSRVHALKGMLLEATQDPQEALKFYKEILVIDPTNVIIRKRQITFSKSLGRIADAISYLAEYLNIYYTDGDAWIELAELYNSIEQFDRGAFSLSEALLLKPHDHATYATYADTLYAQWQQNPSAVVPLHAALRNYLRSVELHDDYLRGFCGIKRCCDQILLGEGTRTNTKNANSSAATGELVMAAKVESLRALSLQWLLKARKDQALSGVDARVHSLLAGLTSSQNTMIR